MLKKTLAAAAIAVVALLAVPTAAHADYVPDNKISAPATVAPGGTAAVSFGEAAFTGGEQVTFQVTGEGTATLAIVRAATVSLTKTASATGAVSVSVTLPTGATGTYTLTATGQTSGTVGTAALTAAAADAGSALPVTGGEIPFAVIWVAAGAVALGVVFVVVLGMRRRHNNA